MTLVTNQAAGLHYVLPGPRLPCQLRASLPLAGTIPTACGTEARVCDQLVRGRCVTAERPDIDSCELQIAGVRITSLHLTTYE